MFEISKRFSVEAAHRLPRVPDGHPCSMLHGHSYVIELGLRGELDEAAGWVRDFAEVSTAFAPIRQQLDHHLLNDVEGLDNPTSEILARWVFDALDQALPELAWVRIEETRSSGCTYRRDV
ncbi:6-carboxytetrahydropterin synthase QueD [Cellulomonas sp. S1-8]|uniref:6-carboxytetrahydropterin synthase QueD n=1 Tax=Cellulomonas sp. S1-8 TaxID=2904790 RepID=UPI0022440AD3|nr:6-carboxytetrahydropterin synthase QueD [Cellulomonas sp. S1-8]UZN02105.1 6-carboxytetrahydropterin synthase QueD [Cellulomonas sp. S1-8]